MVDEQLRLRYHRVEGKALKRYLQIHPDDNAAIALVDLTAGEPVALPGADFLLSSAVPAKHRFALRNLSPGDSVLVYGTLVGRAVAHVRQGEPLSIRNTRHDARVFGQRSKEYSWRAPNLSQWQQKSYSGFPRSDGQVGTGIIGS